MNIILIPSSTWRTNKNSVLNFIQEFNKVHIDKFVFIDENIEKNHQASTSNTVHSLVAVRDFLEMGTTQYGILDAPRIREIPFSSPSVNIIIIDGSSNHQNIIENFLMHCRYGWYELEKWHPAFALVVDDFISLKIANTLANNFYIQPSILSDQELKRHNRFLIKRGVISKYLGTSINKKFYRKIVNMYDRIEHYKFKNQQGKIER